MMETTSVLEVQSPVMEELPDCLDLHSFLNPAPRFPPTNQPFLIWEIRRKDPMFIGVCYSNILANIVQETKDEMIIS